jgi:hypothetical protein
MKDDHLNEKKDNDLLWLGLGVLGGLSLCFLMAVFSISLYSLIPAKPIPPTEAPTPVGEADLAEETLSLLSAVDIPIANPPEIAERLLGISGIPEIVEGSPPELALGAKENFWVTNVGTNETHMVEAELVFISEHVYFWVGEDTPYQFEDVRRVVEGFESSTYPEVRSIIGPEWSPGVDGDPHLYMLYVRGIGSSVAGLFFSKDEYSSLAQEFSNEHEMFYLNADIVDLRNGYADNLLAHEFQHLVHWNLDENEDSWMNEGLSELVEFLLGYEVGGFDFLFSQETDIPMLHWPSQTGTTGPHYGQTFLFMTYLYDRFGVNAIRMIARNPANGLASIEEMLVQNQIMDNASGELLTVEDLFLEWGISLILQDPDHPQGHYGLQSYRGVPQAAFTERYSDCPLRQQSHQVSQFGLDYFLIDCEGEFELSFTGWDHIELVSANPQSGNYVFWSNQGDSSDMTLTRAFDFRNVEAPIIVDYWTWYWIEEDYDYVYLEASTDGGGSWQILETPSGTSDDPSGNSYGWAYNGISGGGGEPIWIQEQVDLSKFAGQEVLLRFEYITDTAVNTEGFLVDDLRISAIEYKEDFEQGSGGWVPEGFVRIHNLLPQTYKLAIIERGSEIRVTEISVDSSGSANTLIQIGGDVEDVILVVTGTSRYSRLPASYRIEITQ